jgi:lipopolysaccharide/colanic/teichoic acid biosynthesis glycosyltransferase
VIFSTDVLSYADILAVIGRTLRRSVNFRLVPSGIDVIIGKTHIDELDDIPLVEIEYNIDKQVNRFSKRLFDIVLSSFFMAGIYPAVMLRKKSGTSLGVFGKKMLLLPEVFFGRMSFVGPPKYALHEIRNGSPHAPAYLGKPGLTGLVQVNYYDNLSPAEVEQYNLYYAKNQSLVLDMEILIKALTLFIKG